MRLTVSRVTPARVSVERNCSSKPLSLAIVFMSGYSFVYILIIYVLGVLSKSVHANLRTNDSDATHDLKNLLISGQSAVSASRAEKKGAESFNC